MNDSTSCDNTLGAESYNSDFKRICLALRDSKTIWETELNLSYAFSYALQLCRDLRSVELSSNDTRLITASGSEPSLWARAAWKGFHRAILMSGTPIYEARVIPVRGRRGSVVRCELENLVIRETPLQTSLALSLEHYADEIERQEELARESLRLCRQYTVI